RRPGDLAAAPARRAPDAERDSEAERAGGDHRHVGRRGVVAELHDRALAELFFDLADGEIERAFAVGVEYCHGCYLLPHASRAALMSGDPGPIVGRPG